MTNQIEFSVDKQIFATLPGYRRAILVVSGVNNKQVSVLGDEIAEIAKNVKDNLSLDDPRITTWRDAFVSFGIKVHDFKPSIDALVRRIHNDKPMGSINPIVDVGTIISLQFVLPAGTHPILHDTTSVRLILAKGKEVEVSDGMHPSEKIPVMEPILLDSDRVATRRWVWRQTNQSRINENTRDFYLNIDALGIIDESTLNNAINYSRDIIRRTFGKDCELLVLTTSNPIQVVEIK